MIIVAVQFRIIAKIVQRPIVYHFHAMHAVAPHIVRQNVASNTNASTDMNAMAIEKIFGLKLALRIWRYVIYSLVFHLSWRESSICVMHPFRVSGRK